MHDDFDEWLCPSDLAAEVDRLDAELGLAAMLGGPGQLYRDAFVASRFALHEQATKVRMLKTGSKPTPDFALERSGVESWFEITEADRPGRKRYAEYKAAMCEGSEVPFGEWTDAAAYFNVVQDRAAHKAEKLYDRCDGLVLISNAFPIAREEELTATWWHNATEPAGLRFSEVHVMLGSLFYRVWAGHERCPLDFTKAVSIGGFHTSTDDNGG